MMQAVQAHLGDTALTLGVPAEFEAAWLANGGLRLTRTDAEQQRQIREITITTAEGDSPVHLNATYGQGPTVIRYGFNIKGGGSGGLEGKLVAERRCGDITIRLRYDIQSEHLRPRDFNPALSMLATARCVGGQ